MPSGGGAGSCQVALGGLDANTLQLPVCSKRHIKVIDEHAYEATAATYVHHTSCSPDCLQNFLPGRHSAKSRRHPALFTEGDNKSIDNAGRTSHGCWYIISTPWQCSTSVATYTNNTTHFQLHWEPRQNKHPQVTLTFCYWLCPGARPRWLPPSNPGRQHQQSSPVHRRAFRFLQSGSKPLSAGHELTQASCPSEAREKTTHRQGRWDHLSWLIYSVGPAIYWPWYLHAVHATKLASPRGTRVTHRGRPLRLESCQLKYTGERPRWEIQPAHRVWELSLPAFRCSRLHDCQGTLTVLVAIRPVPLLREVERLLMPPAGGHGGGTF